LLSKTSTDFAALAPDQPTILRGAPALAPRSRRRYHSKTRRHVVADFAKSAKCAVRNFISASVHNYLVRDN
ncbi:unnamed protein product, partial [Callosobruchus maculatus]